MGAIKNECFLSLSKCTIDSDLFSVVSKENCSSHFNRFRNMKRLQNECYDLGIDCDFSKKKPNESVLVKLINHTDRQASPRNYHTQLTTLIMMTMKMMETIYT